MRLHCMPRARPCAAQHGTFPALLSPPRTLTHEPEPISLPSSTSSAYPIRFINSPTAPRPPPHSHTGREPSRPSLPTAHSSVRSTHHSARHGLPPPPLPRRARGASLLPGRRRRRGAQRHRRLPLRRRPQRHRRHQVLGPLDPGQGDLVRPAQRRRPRRQRWCLRLQAHQPVPVRVHDLLRQPAIVQGRQGVRLMLQDQVQKGPILLRQDGDGDHHRHELLPGGALPLRPQRHGVRPARQARPQRQAPPLRHHRHRVHTGAVRVPGAQDRVPRGGVLEPRLLRGAGGVRGRRRRRGAGGPHGVAGAGRREVDEDEGVVGLHLAPRLQPPPPGAILHPHPQRVRQDARRQQGHPGQLEAQHLLPLLRAVQLNP